MYKKAFLPILILGMCSQLYSAADTIKVDQVLLNGPYQLIKPIEMDSVSPSNKKFSFDKVFSDNKPVFASLSKDKKTIHYGEALPCITGKNSIIYLSFTLTPTQYFKGELKVKGIKNYRVYLDDRTASSSLSLEPRRYNVVLACMNEGKSDTMKISVESKQSEAISVNSDAKRSYTLHDMTDGLHYSSVSVSPTGKYGIIGYMNTSNDGGNRYYKELVEISTQRKLFTYKDESYSWLPNKDVLYYLKNEDNGSSLILVDIPSLKETTIATGIPDNAAGGYLSPNLDYFIYNTNDNSGDNSNNLKHFVLPDDRMAGWRNRTNINIYDLRTGISQPLTYGHSRPDLQDISTDGKYLLFSRSTTDLHRFPFDRMSIYRFTLADSKIDTLVNDEPFIKECTFSPDGKDLLIKGTPDAFNGIGKQISSEKVSSFYDDQLFLFHIDSHKAVALTKTFDPSVSTVKWSRYDGMIYFTAVNGSKISFYSLNPKTDAIHQYNYPVDCIQGYDISELSDRIIYYGQGATYARKMFTSTLSDRKGKSSAIGTIDFDKLSANIAIGSCKQWAFQTSRGDSVRGHFYLPPNFDANKKYPLIVYYYGGCTPVPEFLEINYPYEVWAGLGYIVYVVEPSGTIGYGQEFSSRHVNAWGKWTADDIMEGTKKFCASHPYVNKDRMACIGASYGGFMTEYLLTKTNMYHTAIAHAGISDLTGYWGGGYWGYSYSEVASSKSFPWNNKEMYVNQSPLYNADKINTPLLLIQGSVDTNVPNTQALQLFTALKILGKPVEFIQVKGEDHVIRDYTKQKEWQNTICAWFAKMLKDEPEWWDTLYPGQHL